MGNTASDFNDFFLLYQVIILKNTTIWNFVWILPHLFLCYYIFFQISIKAFGPIILVQENDSIENCMTEKVENLSSSKVPIH